MPAALVTGASRGIGAAIAVRLARDGFDVAVHYHRDEAGAGQTAEKVVAAGRHAELLQADLGDDEAVAALAEGTVARFPELQALVNNAGMYDRRHLEHMDHAAWRRTMAVDLDAPAMLCQALAPTLRAQRGSIIHISSVAAMRGSTHGIHYSAAKAGMLGLTRSLALELAPEVRVNAVCPGYVDTDMISGDTDEQRKARAAEVPLRRVGRPDDVAGTVSFLAGSDAAYVTGQLLHVNGGLWMG